MTDYKLNEWETVKLGVRYLDLSTVLPELGIIGYRGKLEPGHDAAWHRAEFRRQLADPETRKRLVEEQRAQRARVQNFLTSEPIA